MTIIERSTWHPQHGDTVYVQNCAACEGSGSVDDYASADCPKCLGQGWYVTPCPCGCYSPHVSREPVDPPVVPNYRPFA